jgi:rSAM/selenodomain-associated transferase 1
MQNSHHKIVLIGKDAIPEQVKTRMQPEIDPQTAAHIYKELSLHCCRVAIETGYPVEVSFRGSLLSPFAIQLQNLGCTLFSQNNTDLGHIIHRALHRADRVIAMGMDMPLVSVEELNDAMRQKTIVFGAAEDGGYWLIAASRPTKRIFEDITWSTSSVLKQSISRCREVNVRYSLIQTHYDIDTAADFRRLCSDPLLPLSLHNRIQRYA